jgi:hypothetical protein
MDIKKIGIKYKLILKTVSNSPIFLLFFNFRRLPMNAPPQIPKRPNQGGFN